MRYSKCDCRDDSQYKERCCNQLPPVPAPVIIVLEQVSMILFGLSLLDNGLLDRQEAIQGARQYRFESFHLMGRWELAGIGCGNAKIDVDIG